MIAQTLIGAAIAAAVILTAAAVKRSLRLPAGGRGVELYTLIRAYGGAEGLEAAAGAAPGSLIILDCGMEPEARRRAELIAQTRGAAIVRDGGRIFTDEGTTWKEPSSQS